MQAKYAQLETKLAKALPSDPVFRIPGKTNIPWQSPAPPECPAHSGCPSDPVYPDSVEHRGLWVVWAEQVLGEGTQAGEANPAILHSVVLYLEEISCYYSGLCVCT